MRIFWACRFVPSIGAFAWWSLDPRPLPPRGISLCLPEASLMIFSCCHLVKEHASTRLAIFAWGGVVTGDQLDGSVPPFREAHGFSAEGGTHLLSPCNSWFISIGSRFSMETFWAGSEYLQHKTDCLHKYDRNANGQRVWKRIVDRLVWKHWFVHIPMKFPINSFRSFVTKGSLLCKLRLIGRPQESAIYVDIETVFDSELPSSKGSRERVKLRSSRMRRQLSRTPLLEWFSQRHERTNQHKALV